MCPSRSCIIPSCLWPTFGLIRRGPPAIELVSHSLPPRSSCSCRSSTSQVPMLGYYRLLVLGLAALQDLHLSLCFMIPTKILSCALSDFFKSSESATWPFSLSHGAASEKWRFCLCQLLCSIDTLTATLMAPLSMTPISAFECPGIMALWYYATCTIFGLSA